MKPITDFSDFHTLIEIAVRINQRIDEHIEYPSGRTKINLRYSQSQLRKWLRENYNDPGINKRIEADIFGSEIEEISEYIFKN